MQQMEIKKMVWLNDGLMKYLFKKSYRILIRCDEMPKGHLND